LRFERLQLMSRDAETRRILSDDLRLTFSENVVGVCDQKRGLNEQLAQFRRRQKLRQRFSINVWRAFEKSERGRMMRSRGEEFADQRCFALMNLTIGSRDCEQASCDRLGLVFTDVNFWR